MNEQEMLQSAFEKYAVHPRHRTSIGHYLAMLEGRDPKTMQHSIRVGIKAAQIAEHCDIPGVESRALLWAGLLHDIGKALCDPDLFLKTEKFTESDHKRMKPHVLWGWRVIRDVHMYSACIMVLHHRFGHDPYPKILPELPEHLKAKREIIYASGRLLALADYYDALMTRNNAKFGKKLSPTEKRAQYLKDNADHESLIVKLERVGVFDFAA